MFAHLIHEGPFEIEFPLVGSQHCWYPHFAEGEVEAQGLAEKGGVGQFCYVLKSLLSAPAASREQGGLSEALRGRTCLGTCGLSKGGFDLW